MSTTTTATIDGDVRIEEVTEASDEIVAALSDLARPLPRFQRSPKEEHVRAIVDSPATHLLVARGSDGGVLGMLTVIVYHLPTGVRAWFEDVAVSRGGQNQGVGHKLTEAGISRARELGAADVVMMVKPTQTNALRALSKMGFGTNDEDTRRLRIN